VNKILWLCKSLNDDEIISFKLLNEKLDTYNWVTKTDQQFSSFVDVRLLCKII
jgi:hypothetical protein